MARPTGGEAEASGARDAAECSGGSWGRPPGCHWGAVNPAWEGRAGAQGLSEPVAHPPGQAQAKTSSLPDRWGDLAPDGPGLPHEAQGPLARLALPDPAGHSLTPV